MFISFSSRQKSSIFYVMLQMNCSPLLFLMMNTTLCNIFVFVEGLCLFVNDSITVIYEQYFGSGDHVSTGQHYFLFFLHNSAYFYDIEEGYVYQ